jgi:hypothetical protein
MAIRGLKVYQVKRSRKGLSHFDDNFPRFALAGTKNDPVLRLNGGITRASAVRISLETEFAPAKAAPKQQHSRQGHDT